AYYADSQRLFIRVKSSIDNSPRASQFGTHGMSPQVSISCQPSTLEQNLLSPAVFDANYYRTHNGDLAAMDETSLRSHWVNNGVAEGRIAIASFSVIEYLQMYSDLNQAYNGDRKLATQHYVTGGIFEGRLGRRP